MASRCLEKIELSNNVGESTLTQFQWIFLENVISMVPESWQVFIFDHLISRYFVKFEHAKLFSQ